MAEKKTLDLAFKKLQGLRDRFLRLEKETKALKDLLNVHDNWHSTIRSWVGKEVTVETRAGRTWSGKLQWSDRYTFCLEMEDGRPKVFTKGGIDWIEPAH